MSIESFDGTHTPTCDICGEELDAYDDFYDAVEAKKDAGWRSRKINGEWEDLCPACWEKQKPKSAMTPRTPKQEPKSKKPVERKHKVCPFCGGEPGGFRNIDVQDASKDGTKNWVKCKDCGSRTAFFTTLEGAWEIWDKRTQ